MIELTEQEIKLLTKYEDAFRTAVESNYIKQSVPTADVIQLRALYSKIIGYQYKMTNSCGKCVLTLMKRLAKYYNEYKNGREEESRKTTETETKSDGTGQVNEEEIHTSPSDEGREQSDNRRSRSKKVGS